MTLRERLYSAEEFFDYAALPENDDKRLELDDGVIIEMAASSPINTVTAIRLATFINVYVMQNDLGYVTGADGGFKLSSKRVRQPDVGFISKTRLPTLPARFNLPPDLAVEVVSEDEDIFRKAREYLHSGVRLVWAIYADEQVVYVMTLNEQGGILSLPFGVDDTLDGGDVLPGFTLPVRDIFPA